MAVCLLILNKVSVFLQSVGGKYSGVACQSDSIAIKGGNRSFRNTEEVHFLSV